MDIDRHNFAESLPAVREAVAASDFIALDLELTGLHVDRAHAAKTVLDSTAERYARDAANAHAFAISQLGVCCARRTADGALELRPFNVHLFPARSERGPDRRFLVQPSSLAFLAANGFDFNRWVRDGVEWVSREQEARLAARRGASDVQPRTADDRAYMDDVRSRFTEWLAAGPVPESALELSAENGFRRLLVHRLVESEADGRAHTRTVDGAVHVRAGPHPEPAEEVGGARLVFDAVLGAGRPVIGHNAMLDMLHCYDAFVGDLPPTAAAFRAAWHELVPLFIDTKQVASSEGSADDTGLGPLYEAARAWETTPAVTLPPAFSSYADGTDRAHEAGYDAYMTAVVYAALAARHGGDAALAERHGNHVHLMRSFLAFPLTGEDIEVDPVEHHVLRLTFPAEVRTADVHALFTAELHGPAYVSWIDGEAAFVRLPDFTGALDELCAHVHATDARFHAEVSASKKRKRTEPEPEAMQE